MQLCSAYIKVQDCCMEGFFMSFLELSLRVESDLVLLLLPQVLLMVRGTMSWSCCLLCVSW